MNSPLPRTTDRFVYHTGARQVNGEFTLIYQSTNHVQVHAQGVVHKSKTFNIRANLVRQDDGTFSANNSYAGGVIIVNSADYSRPTDAQRRDLFESAVAFAQQYYTEDEDGAGEIAAAEREVESAQALLNSLQAKLVTAADRRDQAQARLDQAREEFRPKITSDEGDSITWAETTADLANREHTAKLLDVSVDRVTIDETGIHVAPKLPWE